ncbi:MAG TPA: GNAT family N-acetyltransferase, partial [Trinickia sp.]|nr:GNAT family N-acetyltransferase [Trinickia sp.]
MEPRRNAYGQPIGVPVPAWQGAQAPGREPLTGRYC